MRKKLAFIVALLIASFGMVQCQQPPSLSTIQIVPAQPALTYVGQTMQMQALGTFNSPGHPSTTKDITSQVTWQTSNAGAASISNTGLATAVAAGSTTLTATTTAFVGTVQGTTTLSVTGQTTHDLTSILVIPNDVACIPTAGCPQPTTQVGESAQFIAIGSFNTAPLTEDVTNQVVWVSSDVQVAAINSTGLAVANSPGETTITALGRASSGASIVGTSNLTVVSVVPPTGPVQLPALNVYEVGQGSGTVTSSPVGVNCNSNTSSVGCTANFVLGATVTLTAEPAAGSTFGGWSANCTPTTGSTCTVIMNNNEPVGAVFNKEQ